MNKIIENKITGETFEFLETSETTNGKLFKFKVTLKPNAFFPISHIHPTQDESFYVEKGSLKLKVKDQILILNPGESYMVPKMTSHQWWNSDQETILVVELTPAENTAEFIEKLAKLANSGKCNKIGLPSLPQTFVFMNKYKTYKSGFPGLFLQQLTGFFFGRFFKLFGYKD